MSNPLKKNFALILLLKHLMHFRARGIYFDDIRISKESEYIKFKRYLGKDPELETDFDTWEGWFNSKLLEDAPDPKSVSDWLTIINPLFNEHVVFENYADFHGYFINEGIVKIYETKTLEKKKFKKGDAGRLYTNEDRDKIREWIKDFIVNNKYIKKPAHKNIEDEIPQPRVTAHSDEKSLLSYLESLVNDTKYIKLPPVSEGSYVPQIPLETVYVTLKVQQAMSQLEISEAHRFFQKKLLEKLKELAHEPSVEDIMHLEAQLLEEYPIMRALENDLRQSNLHKEFLEDEKNVTISFSEAFKRQRYLVILGAPGSGKSTIVQWTAHQLAKAFIKQIQGKKKLNVIVPVQNVITEKSDSSANYDDLGPARFPILLKVSEYASAYEEKLKKEKKNLPLVDFITGLYDKKIENGKEIIKRYFNDNNVVLMLDGMDEISTDRGTINLEIEKFIEDWIKRKGLLSPDEDEDFLKEPCKNGGNQIIITSRIVGYQQAPLKKTTFTHATIEAMEADSVSHFCNIWTRYIVTLEYQKHLGELALKDKIAGEAEALRNAVFANTGTMGFASTPLTLTLLAVVFKADRSLPKRRVELYERLSEMLIEKWRDSGLTTPEVYHTLPDIAFYMHSKKDTITERELIIQTKTSIANYRNINVSDISKHQEDKIIIPFVKKLQEQVGLIAEAGQKTYKFYHRSFQEFFAAISLLRHDDETLQTITTYLDDPVWREPIYMALEYAALGKKSLNFKIEVTSENLVNRLLDAVDPLQDLLPRITFLVAAVLPEMEDIKEDIFNRIIIGLLDYYLDEQKKYANKYFKERIEVLLEKTYNSSKRPLLERVFINILNERNSNERIHVISYLIYFKKWFNAKFELPFQRLIYLDSPYLNFPINSSLQKYYSSEESNQSTSPNLFFKKKLLTDSELLSKVFSSRQWVKLVTVLYGGIPNTDAGATWISLQEMRRNIHTKSGTSDQRYNWAVTLDTTSGENSKKVFVKPCFNPKYIFKESFFTKKILAHLENGNAPEDLTNYFEDIIKEEPNKFKKAEALLALSVLDYKLAMNIARKKPEIIDMFLHSIEQTKIMLGENLVHYFAYLTHKRKNVDELKSLFNIDDENEKIASYLYIRQTNNTLKLPPLDICYTISEKRLFETTDIEHRAIIETDGWLSRLFDFRQDRIYNLAVLLDTCASLLKKDEKLFAYSLKRLSMIICTAKNIQIKNDKRNIPLSALVGNDDITGIFDLLQFIPTDMDFFKDWLLWSLDSKLKEDSDLLPEAILHAITISSVKFRNLYPEYFGDGKTFQLVLRRISSIKKCHIKFRAYLQLFKLSFDLSILKKCVELIEKIDEPEQKILSIIAVCHIPINIIGPWKKNTMVFFFSKIPSLFEIANNNLSYIKSQEERILLRCKLTVLRGEYKELMDVAMDTLEEIKIITDPVIKERVISASISIFDEKPEVKKIFENQLREIRISSPFRTVVDGELLDYISMVELFNLFEWFTFQNFSHENIEVVWESLLTTKDRKYAYQKLLSTGNSNGALLLTKPAFKAITGLFTGQEKNNKGLLRLLAHMYLPDQYDINDLGHWSNMKNSFLSAFSSLLIAEQGHITEPILRDLVGLLQCDNDKIRFRTSIAIHGLNPSSLNSNRIFKISKTDLRALNFIYQQRFKSKYPYIITKFCWFDHNIIFDSFKHINEIIDKSKRHEDNYRHLCYALRYIECINNNSIYELKRMYFTLDVEIKKQLLRSFLRLSYVDKVRAREFADFLSEDDINQLDSLNLFDFSFDEILKVVLLAIQHNDHQIVAFLNSEIRKNSKILFKKSYDLGPENFALTLRKAGSTFYVNTNSFLNSAKEVANEFQKYQNFIPSLMTWTFDTLLEELNSDENDYLGSYLVLLLGFVVERNPDIYSGSDIIKTMDIENLLNRTLTEHNSWVTRRGAIVLLSYLNEKSELSIDSLTEAMRDVSFVQEGVEVCWRYFESIFNEKRCIDKVMKNMYSESGYLSSTSVKILSEIARSKKCPELERKRIIAEMAKCLRTEISSPLKNEIFFTDDLNSQGIIHKGSIEDLLYRELSSITAL